MGKNVNVTEEYKKFNYLLDDETWKEEAPSFTLYASPIQAKNPKVSIIIANFNNGPYLERMMDSLMNQTMGLGKLQVMFIDDRSTDNSLSIVKPYTENYPNVEIYHLDKNTGGAHGPRNVGLLNARGEYFVFLDADDWYAPDGLKILSDLLDESGDGIAFSGIMRSTNGHLFRGDEAYIEEDRINRPIGDLPYEFYSWLGPQANMVRASIVKEHNLHFIDQRVADDVTFFLQVMRLSGTISQTTKLTTYLNRDDDNASLSKSVNETFLQSWLRSLSYLKNNYEMDTSMERFLSKRLEWLVIDFALRWDTGYGFSKEKVQNFSDLLDQYVGDLPFDPSQYFKTEDQKVAWRALKEKDFDYLVRFYEWSSLPFFDKRLELIDDQYYFVSDDPSLPKVTINTRIEGNFVESTEDKLIVDFNVYTNESVDRCYLRSLRDPWDNRAFELVHKGGVNYQLVITREEYEALENNNYEIHVRTNRYHDNQILIQDIEQYLDKDTVFQIINGAVALTKPEVAEESYLIVKPLEDGDYISEAGGEIPKAVRVVESSFMSSGKVAFLCDDKSRLVADPDVVMELPGSLSDLQLTQLTDEYNTEIGVYMASEDLTVYKSPALAENDAYQLTIQAGMPFEVQEIDFSDNRLVFEIGFGKYVDARKAVSTKLVGLKDYVADTGMYTVISDQVSIYAKPDLSSEKTGAYSFQEVLLAEKLVFDEKNQVLMFETQDGFILASDKDMRKHNVREDDGYYHEGTNFIVAANYLDVYTSKEMQSEDKSGTIPKGTMFKAAGFAISSKGEYSIEITENQFVRANKALFVELNHLIDITQYSLKPGKYEIVGNSEKGYHSPSFGEPSKARTYAKGDVVNGVGFGVSEKGYPRLKLSDGNFITSNTKYINYKGE